MPGWRTANLTTQTGLLQDEQFQEVRRNLDRYTEADNCRRTDRDVTENAPNVLHRSLHAGPGSASLA